MPTLKASVLAGRRAERYRLNEKRRLKDAAAIRSFVDDCGFCLLFPAKGLEAPNVYQAVAGYAKEMTAKHDDYAISLTWTTKDTALDKRWWWYGKLLRGKATLISLALFPAFYALSENFGNLDEDYLTEYQAGSLSADAKNIYEALLKHGPMHAIELKRKSNLYGDESKGRFDKALNELQTGLKVMPVGVAEAGAWRYAFVYDIVGRYLPDVAAQAQTLTRGEARDTILRAHLRNVIHASPKDISRLFGWKPTETTATLARLSTAGDIDRVDLADGPADQIVWLRK
jgi:Winged helix DNA-binding domain